MSKIVHINIGCPEAQKYADLNGIRYDLEDSRRFAVKLVAHGIENSLSPDSDLCEALKITCLIKYWRFFGEGVRKSLLKLVPDIIDSLPEHLQENHKIFGLWRNKNIAHSVDECEDNQPHIGYYEEMPEAGFVVTGCTSTSLRSMATRDAENLVELVNRILEKLNPIIENEAKILHMWFRSQPFDEMVRNSIQCKNGSYKIGQPRKQTK